MKIKIQPARKNDLSEYTKLLQKTYQDTYTDENLGLTKECFSEEIFNTPDTQKHLASNLINNAKQKCWLAFIGSGLVGSVTIIERGHDYELRGFYVTTEHHGKGIGRKLWNHVLSFARGKDITCDIYAHNTKTIELYKKWGFEIDIKRGEFSRHWPEWPEGVIAKAIYMRYKIS